MGGLRWTVAGGALAAYMWIRVDLSPPSQWRAPLLLGFLMLVLGNGGVVWAELYVPSGLTAVVVASSPFWMAGVEALYRIASASPGTRCSDFWSGSGIVLLIWPELRGATGRLFVLGMVALQVACLGWAIGSSA